MVSPEEIFEKSRKRYFKVLSAFLGGETLPLDFKVNKSYLDLTPEQFRISITSLLENSDIKKRNSYTIAFKRTKTKQFGEQDIPTRIYYKSMAEYIRTLDKEAEFNELTLNAALLKEVFPGLQRWIACNPGKIISNSKNWKEIVRVIQYLITDYERDKFYVRELPVDVHTKFIEMNSAIIQELFCILAPEKYNAQRGSFYSKLGLKEPAQKVALRYLDPSLYLNNSFTDLTFTLNEFRHLSSEATKVFIVENNLNFITFPDVKGGIVLWGKGFEVEKLKVVDWLNEKEIYYWGDLDTYGLAILSQLREYFPEVKSIFMEMEDVNTYKHFGGRFVDRKERDLEGLTSEEIVAYNFLFQNNLRIEQEKIPQIDLIERLRRLKIID